MAINAALAALAGGLTGTAQGLDVMQTGLEKEKQRRIDNEYRQMQADREESFRKMQVANMEAQRKLQQDTFNASQEQIGRQNTHQSLLDIAPESALPPSLLADAQKYNLEGLTHTKEGQNVTGLGNDILGQLMPSANPMQVRSATGQETRQRTLDDSTLASQRLSQESAQASLDTNAIKTQEHQAAGERIKSALAKDPTGRSVNPMDVVTYSGHMSNDIFPDVQMDIDSNKKPTPLIGDIIGYDPQTNQPIIRQVKKVEGQETSGLRPASAGAGNARTQDAQQTLNLAKAALDLGRKLKWSGVGPIAANVNAPMYSMLGIGNKDEAQLREMLDDLYSGIGHKRYGGALTPNEQAMLNKFTPQSGISGPANETNLQQIISQLELITHGGVQTPQTPIPDIFSLASSHVKR